MFDSIDAMQAALDQRRTTAISLCDAMIDRTGRLDGKIGAYSDLLTQSARLEAIASDDRRRRGECLGPLDGIPFAIKDLIETSPSVSDCGLGVLMRRATVKDAAVVHRLRNAGAVILGVTHTDAGGFGTTTPQTINPIAGELIAGGSSGGSAVAIASGMAFGALGTDTGGSIRIPAACCCIVGFKPSWGRIPTVGVQPLAPSFDHVGSLARSVSDVAIIQRVIDPCGDDQDPIIARLPKRIGRVTGWSSTRSSFGDAALANLADLAGHHGVECRSVELPAHNNFLDAHVQDALREAFDCYCGVKGNWSTFPLVAQESLALGQAVSNDTFDERCAKRAIIADQVECLFKDIDVLVLPTLPMEVPKTGVTSISLPGIDLPMLQATIHFTALFNYTGHPVVSMPAYMLADGRAVSIQIVGKKGSDFDLLSAALWFEQLLDIHIDYAALVKQGNASEIQELQT